MKKIGLVLAFNKGSNYGSVLQAFATQYIVDKMGVETEIIDYHPVGTQINKSFGAFVYLGCLYTQKIFKKKEKPWDECHINNKAEREKIAREFCSRRLHNVFYIKGEKALKAYSINYDAVIVGSDQNWLPHISFTDFYTLQFAEKGVTRISYSTSMGVDKYPWYTHSKARDFLRKIDFLSVREKSAQKIIKNIAGINSTLVLDPAYLVTKEEWNVLIPPKKIIEGKYIFCFFLGSNIPFKKRIKEYANTNHLKIVTILSSEVCEDDSFYADEILTGKTPEDFINIIRYAECIFTDSFHCLAFSIINEKQVSITYRVRKGKKSRNSRIDNIIEIFDIKHRLFKTVDDFNDAVTEIDYKKVNKILASFREQSLLFLTDAIKNSGINKEKIVTADKFATEKRNCCGCGACVAVCPKGILTIEKDNEGFEYPIMIDKNLCINCNKCANVCPIKHVDDINSHYLNGYAGWAKNEMDIVKSASGGAAYCLYSNFIKSNGVVYGAAYNNDFKDVVYQRVEKKEDLEILRGSKYSQASTRGLFESIESDINSSKKVLFIGTPCDTYAVKRYFGNNINLYCISIICHGPTSPFVLKSFVEDLEKKYHKGIKSFTLRYKKDDQWKPYYIESLFVDNSIYLEKFEESDFNIAFQFFKRPSCTTCRFKNNKIDSDLIIGDFHGSHNGCDCFNDKGVSVILSLTEKGEQLVKDITDLFYYEKVDINRCINTNLALFSPVYKKTDRNKFASDLNQYGLHQACNLNPIKQQAKVLKNRKRFDKSILKVERFLIHLIKRN